MQTQDPRTLDPTSLDTMRASASEQGRRARVADLAPSPDREPGLGDRDDLITWLRSYRADEEALDVLPEADREGVYESAWKAYSDPWSCPWTPVGGCQVSATLETPEVIAGRLASKAECTLHGNLVPAHEYGAYRGAKQAQEQIITWCDEHAKAADREAAQHSDDRTVYCEGQAAAFRALAAIMRGVLEDS